MLFSPEFRWSEVADIKDTAFTVKNLNPEDAYVFRVIAINKAGRSTPSEESDYLHLRKEVVQEAPVIQEQLTDTFVARTSVLILSCVIGGVPEPQIEWFKDNEKISGNTITYSNRVAKLTIQSTSADSAGSYKCVASNICGRAETTCSVIVREVPDVHIEDRFVSQKLRIDGEYVITATVSGYPRPKLVWYKSKTKLEAKANTKMVYEETEACLTISKLKRSHTGTYAIEASNEHGVCRKEVVLTIIDKPSCPEGPLSVTTLKKDTVELEWKPPRDCGGLELSHYVVEKCCQEQKTWIKVGDVDKDTLKCTVPKLKTDAQFKFRVRACNAIGDSEPLESEVVTIRLSVERPSPPRGPIEVSGMTTDSFVVSWMKSESDGGSAITEYLVDIKKSTESKWTHRGATSANVTHLTIKDLSQSTGYDVRICARNAVGDSLFLESSESIVTGRLPSKWQVHCGRYIAY